MPCGTSLRSIWPRVSWFIYSDAEIAESKAALDGTSDLADDDLLREDGDEQDDWKTTDVQSSYDQVLRRAVQIGAELVELKALLDARIK